MTRTCKVCNQNKPIGEFAFAGEVDGKRYYRHKCVKCYSKFKKARRVTIRDQYFEIKKSLQCAVCGNADFRVLDFDHKDRESKEFDVGYGISKGYSIEKIKKEIDKCQVLCANCHRIKTWDEKEYGK